MTLELFAEMYKMLYRNSMSHRLEALWRLDTPYVVK